MREKILVAAIVVLLASIAMTGYLLVSDIDSDREMGHFEHPVEDEVTAFQNFSSYNEIEEFIEENRDLNENSYYYENLYSRGYWRYGLWEDDMDGIADSAESPAPSLGGGFQRLVHI